MNEKEPTPAEKVKALACRYDDSDVRGPHTELMHELLEAIEALPPVTIDLAEWDRQHDALRERLVGEAQRIAALGHHENFELMMEQVNRMEVARRVLHAFVATGKVEVPE